LFTSSAFGFSFGRSSFSIFSRPALAVLVLENLKNM